MKLSILIPTLTRRAHLFERIYGALSKQAEGQDVEILHLLDSGQMSIGDKRNTLLFMARGEFSCFVDDDDMVAGTYVGRILKAIEAVPDADCVGMAGIITSGRIQRKFIHSIQCSDYTEGKGVYYRPPNHLNPIRTEISRQFRFPAINMGEDTDWAMQISRSGALTKEAEIEEALYFYTYVANKQY